MDQLIKLRVAVFYVHFYVHAILEYSLKMASKHETSDRYIPDDHVQHITYLQRHRTLTN
jgi:hypothetical protein